LTHEKASNRGRIILHNRELHDLHFSPDIITNDKMGVEFNAHGWDKEQHFNQKTQNE
jgi:hypothetical protein